MSSNSPAGWHPDPHQPGRERFWDGNVWTDQYRPVEATPGAAGSEPPPDRPWYRRTWVPWVVAGLTGLTVGAAAAGSDTSSTKTETVTEAASEAKTVTVDAPAAKAKTVTKTVTVTKKAAAPKPSSSTGSSGGSAQSFSGNGGKKLSPFTTGPATLKWTNDGDLFQVFDLDSDVTINSQAHSGETFLEGGSYTLEVNAIGNWTIRIVPQ